MWTRQDGGVATDDAALCYEEDNVMVMVMALVKMVAAWQMSRMGSTRNRFGGSVDSYLW